MIKRAITFIFGIVLIPFCWAITRTVINLIEMVQPASDRIIPAPTLALGGGFCLWLILYFTCPRPTRTYVLAHELTHALWAIMMRGKVSKMRISKDSGSVTLSKSNFLIVLAPYFFPLYTVLVILGYYALSIFFTMSAYELVWLGLVGFTWGFHFTFTITTLLQHQTDIREYGHLFSYAVIYIFNSLGVGLWVVMVSTVKMEEMIDILGENTHNVAIGIWNIIKAVIDKF